MLEDSQTIVNWGIWVCCRNFFCEDTFHFPANPAGIIEIVDHQIHQNAARFEFVKEPVASGFLWPKTAAIQTDDAWLADLHRA